MPQDMGPSRAPRTFGILSIVFSSLVLLGSLFGLIGLVVPVMIRHAPPSSAADQRTLQMLSTMYLGMGLISAILTVMSALLIALGIGQLRYRRWAAVWSVRWGVVALGAVVVMAMLCATMFGQSVSNAVSMDGPMKDPAAARMAGNMFGAVYAVMIVFFYAPYPILLMVFFSRPRLRAVMTA